MLKLLFFTLLLTPSLSMISLNTIKGTGKSEGSSKNPVTILVHGLDSSSKTWETTMPHLDGPSVAVDQRGSGYSPLGNPDNFSQSALVEDLHQVITANSNDEKVVLIGHSLGGRVVLSYAATYPDKIAALVIEDMDIEERIPTSNGLVQLKDYDGVFDRQRDSKEALIQALKHVGYPDSFVERALGNGRLEQNAKAPQSSTWWSHINPDFRKLCYEHVLSTSQGKADCRTLASLFKENKIDFPIHVLLAGKEGTVCIEDSIQEMKEILGDEQLTVHRYPDAAHSIHSTEPLKYQGTINDIIRKC
jgi:pimeloyl-ACP methyl ester carboxylesterase